MLNRFLAARKIAKSITALVCSSLLIAMFAPFGIAGGGRKSFLRGRAQESGPSPRAGAPEGILPNLDEVRNGQLPQPIAPPSVMSTLRSRRNPLVPRTVLHVGDPLPSPSVLPSPLPSPSLLPSPSPLPSPSTSPLASPSLLPSPSPLPSPSTSPLSPPLVSASGARSTPWTHNGLSNPQLLSYLLAWNVQPTFHRSGDAVLNLYRGQPIASYFSQWHPDPTVSSNTAFDFFLVPLPQAGSTRIVFTSNRDSGAQIYSMDVNGGNLVRLTNNGSNDDHPRWSPNGTKILFQSDRDSTPPADPDNPGSTKQDIYVMNADGTGQTRLTTDSADDCNAEWSPDGSKIIFQSLRNGVYYQVYSMNANGSSQLNVSNGATADTQPSWSPNGSQIAFASERDHAGVPGIYVMNANGSNQIRLTFTYAPFKDEQPVWSRDGMKLAFVSTRDSVIETWQETDDNGGLIQKSAIHTNKEIYLMNADGSNQLRLTNTLENDDSPFWSPDNTKIVFRSEREREAFDPTPQLLTMNADGSNQATIVSNVFGDFSPGWATGTTGNQPPIANSGGPYSGLIAQNLAFSAAGSFDQDGTIASYAWNFGDSGTGSGVTPTHAYASAGTYTISLTVTDNLGAQATANTTTTITVAGSDQYLANFNLFALGRQPYTNESSYWNDILRAAYPNGQTSMLLSLRELGKTLFESSAYSARGRNNHWYVYDLYKTYLMREPDAPGWAFWENEVPGAGRENIRRAFDECGEFASIVATLTPTGSPSSTVSSLASARVDPFNLPGNALTSRDAEWSVSLLSLPGRAGLDLGLSLSYSSMVWTHSGPYIYFDEDNGWPGPGFRLGFPTIQERVFDAQARRNVYLMTTGGGRVSLRQLGTSSVYEAADSSYLQLIDYGGSLLVRTTDGMQLTYQSFNNEWRCTQLKDRNGNYISVNYDWLGHITTIIDTLARTITFNYDTNANLLSITQSWTVNGSPQTHTWASFGWSTKTIQPSFSGVMAVGAVSGYTFPVITHVGLDDGTRFTFEYNGSGQVNPIRSYRSDDIERAYTAYDYDSPADDCPRLIDTHVWAENWTGINGVPQEVATLYGAPGDGSHTITTPDGTLYKEFYGTGYKRGLTIQTEVWSGGVKQKWTTNDWIQDDTAVNYQTNPRVTETNIFDASGNRRRATVSYAPFTLPSGASCPLPIDTREYAGDANTVLRYTHIDYRMDPTVDAAYLERHIIGLVKEQTLYEVSGGGETLRSKVGFAYDAADSIQGSDAPIRHDNDNYGATFVAGRANLSSVKRYDVNVTDNSVFTVSTSKYNAAGAIVDAIDPLAHHTTLSYADSFSDGNNARNTLAYPKTVTDADGYSSTLIYNFDFGGVTSKQTPQPNIIQNVPGPLQTLTYDAAGRIERVTTATNGAYTHYVYGPNYLLTLSTVNNASDEAYSNSVVDGMGRTIVAATNHPGIIEGRYSAVNTIYDFMGREVKQSNPTETNSEWVPAGDDVAGWLYTQQSFDWKGRPLVTTNTDLTTKQASYTGCGCAGGEVVTLTDETSRRQRITSDVLGRAWKTEILNGNSTTYSTTANTYNARDQVQLVRQYQGAETSNTYQDTTMTYDGHGRLATQKKPEQTSPTSYTYFADDTIEVMTDARGATTTFGYNGRHLISSVAYGGGYSAPSVTLGYDAAGNRTSMSEMSDGVGSVTYSYDQLSRLASEVRYFRELGQSFTLSYGYNLANQVTSISDPNDPSRNVSYTWDSTGRVTDINGNGYGGVNSFANTIQYRASGATKHVSYGNGLVADLQYNNRLQTSHFELKLNSTGARYLGVDYQYTTTSTSGDNDGRLKLAHDLDDSALDRTDAYDVAGRESSGYAGAYLPNSNVTSGPYQEGFSYDVWGNLSGRTWRQYETVWTPGGTVRYPATRSYSETFVNNRSTNPGWSYDADGRALTGTSAVNSSYTQTNSYDAAGQMISTSVPGKNYSFAYDGSGQRLKFVENGDVTYYVTSTVLGGQVVAELNQSGAKKRSYVYAGGQVVAKQEGNQVLWDNRDSTGRSTRMVNSSATVTSRVELDPLSVAVDPTNVPEGNSAYSISPVGFYGAPQEPSMGCRADNVPTSCNLVQASLRAGGSIECLGGPCPTVGWTPNRDGPGRGGFHLIRYDAFGNQFGVPIGGPQKAAAGNKSPKESKECAAHRARLLGDQRNKSALEDAWKRSQVGAVTTAHEEGGLLGTVIDYGQPYQRDQIVNAIYSVPQNVPSVSLDGVREWAIRKMASDANVVTYNYHYHTHPHNTGDVIPGVGFKAAPVTIGNVDIPSGADVYVSNRLNLPGVIVNKEHIIVFKGSEILCTFNR